MLALRHPTPALLLPLAAVAWIAGASGVTLMPAAAIAIVAIAAVLAVAVLRRGVRLEPPLAWAASLAAWVVTAAVARPVPPAEAAWLAATAGVAVAFAAAARAPRASGWARIAVVTAGSTAAFWLLGEAVALGRRPAGPFDNPNMAATLAVLALAMVPRLAVGRTTRGILGALLIAGIVASESRGGMLGAAAVGAVWLVRARDRRLRAATLAAVGIALAALAGRLLLDRDPLRFERLRIWGVALRTVRAEMPLGAGPGGFADAALPHNFAREGEFARYHRVTGVAESDWLQLAASLGLPGLLLGASLAVSLARRIADPTGWGVLAGLAVTSAVNTQLPVPAVAWTAALAIGGTLPRPRGRVVRVGAPAALALTLAVAAPAAAALCWPRGGILVDPRALLEQADALAAPGGPDGALADAETLAWRAAHAAPRWGRAWRTLGWIELARAQQRRESALAGAAADAFGRARRLNRLDAWAALGEGRARRLLGEGGPAREALRAAVELEPNFAVAWLELALVDLERGELKAARRSLAGVQHALSAASAANFVSAYERNLVAVDPALLERVRRALEGAW